MGVGATSCGSGRRSWQDHSQNSPHHSKQLRWRRLTFLHTWKANLSARLHCFGQWLVRELTLTKKHISRILHKSVLRFDVLFFIWCELLDLFFGPAKVQRQRHQMQPRSAQKKTTLCMCNILRYVSFYPRTFALNGTETRKHDSEACLR